MTAAGTGCIVRLRLLGMTVQEQNGQLARESIIDRMARGESIATPGERLDIRDYLDLALRSGFPEALSISGATARQRWLEGYVAQIITRDPTGTVGARDPLRLSRYLEAYALNSAGITEAKSIYEAAGIDRGPRLPMNESSRTSSSSSRFPPGGPTGSSGSRSRPSATSWTPG